MQVSWGMFCITENIYNYLESGALPSEKLRRRNYKIILAIWIVSLADWGINALMLGIYTKKKNFHLIWNMMFAQMVIVDVFFLIAELTLLVTLYRFVQIYSRLREYPRNKPQLKKAFY